MKTLASFLLAVIFTAGAFAQEPETLSKSEIRKLQREQRKAEEAQANEQAIALTRAMIENQHFVLEADYLNDKRGSRVPVQSMINFILVDSIHAVIQFGSAHSVGYNGVGGVTMEGRINNYKYTTTGRDKNSYSVHFNFMSSLGNYDITLLSGPTGYADATIRGNWSGQLTYTGNLVPLQESRIYKGSPTY